MNLGSETKVKALGKEWTFSRLELRVIEKFRDWIEEQIGDPFAKADRYVNVLPPEEAKAMIKEAEEVQRNLRCFNLHTEFAQQWMGTPSGMGNLVAFMLEDHHPEVNADLAFRIVIDMGDDQLQKILKKAEGSATRQPGGKSKKGNPPTSPTGTTSSGD